MAESFVPVDLDKLLDEFEEQESPRSFESSKKNTVVETVKYDLDKDKSANLCEIPDLAQVKSVSNDEADMLPSSNQVCSREENISDIRHDSGCSSFLSGQTQLGSNGGLVQNMNNTVDNVCLEEDLMSHNFVGNENSSDPGHFQKYNELMSQTTTDHLSTNISERDKPAYVDNYVSNNSIDTLLSNISEERCSVYDNNLDHTITASRKFVTHQTDEVQDQRLQGMVGSLSTTTPDVNQHNKTGVASNESITSAQQTNTEPLLYFLRDHFGQLSVDDITEPFGQDRQRSCDNIDQPVTGVNNSNLSTQQLISDNDSLTDEPSSVLRNDNDQLLRNSDQSNVVQLGYNQPQWMPDHETDICLSCNSKFTVVRRRHHCRACGKVFCSSCCNLKFNLRYLGDKSARVCQACANVLLQRQASLNNSDVQNNINDDPGMYLYSSTEVQQAYHGQTTVNEGEEIQDDDSFYYDNISDNITNVPDDVTNIPDDVTAMPSTITECGVGDNVVSATQDTVQGSQFRPSICSSSSSVSSVDAAAVNSTIPLPPVLRKTQDGLKVDNTPNHPEILYLLKKKKETVTFLLNKNLIVKVKIVKLKCCVKRKCWCFSSEGMGAADQEDMVILLECLPKELCIPQDVLSHFNTAFAYAKQGHRVTDLGYTIFGQPFLGSLRNAGFLYIKSSFQCLENLIVPPGPHIFGILIQREEVSWVQLFPIRLILRLGAEYRYYPCPLWSVRDRDALYGDTGHTIMDLLADFKNFQYTLPRVTGMYVHLENKRTVIQLPQNRYDEVVKVLNATDEYVMAFEATFSNVADSHLVCIQDGTGYKTQAINIEGQERKVTGASFVVFNGALKTTTDMKAKVSIVEDGVMIQMVMQVSQEMRQAMREMRDFTINTGNVDNEERVQEVVLEWITKGSSNVQTYFSPIDGTTLGDTTDIKINTHFDYSTPSIYRLCWSQLFFLGEIEERPRSLSPQFKKSAAEIAKSCTVALRPYLETLKKSGKSSIGLRVNLNPDTVGYTIGCQGTKLADDIVTKLDDELVPAINSAVTPSNNEPSSMEFLFNIIEVLS